MITIQELLYNRGLAPDKRIKIVRHKDTNTNVLDLYKNDKSLFLEYQAMQKKDVFNNVDYIVSFLGTDNVSALFVGVFAVNGKKVCNDFVHYDLSEVGGFDDLKAEHSNKVAQPHNVASVVAEGDGNSRDAARLAIQAIHRLRRDCAVIP